MLFRSDLGTAVVYASLDGLVLISGTSATLELSQQFFTRHDIRARWAGQSQTVRLAALDGNVVVFTSSGNSAIIRLDEAAGTMTDWTGAGYAAFPVPVTDDVLITSPSGVYAYADGPRGGFTWHSADVILPQPRNFGAAQFIGEGDITVQVYADGVVKHTELCSANKNFRLPSGFLARRWSVKFTGTGTVKEFYLAEAMAELSEV